MDVFDEGPLVLQAIRRVQKHLQAAYATEVCRGDGTVGCAGCQAVDLFDKLEMFAREIEDGVAGRVHPAEPTR